MVTKDYIVRVARIRIGHTVRVVDDCGVRYEGEVESLGPRGLKILDSEGVNYGKIYKIRRINRSY